MNDQRLIHAYKKDGSYVGRFVATDEQLAKMGYDEGPEPPANLADLKVTAKAQIRDRHAVLLRELTGDYSVEERDTWSMQLRWAQGYIADQNAAHAELLAGLIPEAARQKLPDPAQYMAEKIAAKDARFANLTMIANRTKAEASAAIDAAVDQAALDIVLDSLADLETAALAELAALNG